MRHQQQPGNPRPDPGKLLPKPDSNRPVRVKRRRASSRDCVSFYEARLFLSLRRPCLRPRFPRGHPRQSPRVRINTPPSFRWASLSSGSDCPDEPTARLIGLPVYSLPPKHNFPRCQGRDRANDERRNDGNLRQQACMHNTYRIYPYSFMPPPNAQLHNIPR